MEERITTAGIVEKDGRFLLGQRKTEGSINNGKWEFIGGKNRWGESVEDTLRREFMEELGVPVAVGRKLAGFDFVNGETLYHLVACEVALESEDFHLAVHSTLEWFTPEQMATLDMVDSDRKLAIFLTKRHM